MTIASQLLGNSRKVLLGLSLALCASGALAAGIGDSFASAEKGGEEQDVFAPDAPAVFVHVPFSDVAAGSTLSCIFIAEDTNGAAPPNFKIATYDFKVGEIANVLDCSLSKPKNGWPVGAYRVDIAIDGKVGSNVKFKVAK